MPHLTADAAAEQRSSELTATDLAAADEFVNGLARSEPPGCRLPLLVELLQSDDTPEAVKVRPSQTPLQHGSGCVVCKQMHCEL